MTDAPKKPGKPRRKKGDGSVIARPPGQDKIWQLRYALGKDDSGKRVTRISTFRGTEKAARAHLRVLLVDVDKGRHLNPSKETLSAFIERWLKWLPDAPKKKVTAKTRERYSELLRRHVVARIGNLPVQKIRDTDLENLYGLLLKEGRDDGAGLSPQTVKHVHRALHRALRFAVKWRVIHDNPAALADAPEVHSSEVEILKEDEIKVATKALRGHPVFPLMMTALGTGARLGELCALTWQDIDLDKGVIHIWRSVSQTQEEGLRIKETKTGSKGVRDVAIPDFVISVLRARKKVLQEQRLALGVGKMPEGNFVFGAITGDLPNPDGLSKRWAKAAKRAGVNVKFHALRHTHASQLIAANIDVVEISRRLGHSNPTVTLNVYGHMFKKDQTRTVAALDAAFSSMGAD
jgi:integrase